MLNKLKTLRVKFIIITFFTYLILVSVVLVSCALRFAKNSITEYEKLGTHILKILSEEIDSSKFDDYLSGDYDVAEYNRIKELMNRYVKYNNEVEYLYVFEIPQEGTTATVIFDADREDDLGEPLGSPYDLEVSFVNDIETLRKGLPAGPYRDYTEYGYLMTCAEPLKDSNGNCNAYIFIDLNMSKATQANRDFMKILVCLELAFMMVVLYAGMRAVSVRITIPIEKLYTCLKNFSYDSDEEQYQNIERLKALNIHTNKEIEELYTALIETTEKSYNLQHEVTGISRKLTVMQDIAFVDAMTGVGNKFAYERQINKYRNLQDLAIVVVDINNLKYINDTYGHVKGDSYIQGCCRQICDTFKKSPVFRVGSDEFVVVLTNDDYKHRNEYIAKLKQLFLDTYINKDLEVFERYSAAIGMAEKESSADIVESIFKRADANMYEDKELFKAKYGSYR